MMNDVVLSIKDLSISYGKKKAISDVTLTVRQGEIIGIVGKSGSGKSTLLKSLLPIDSFGMIRNDGMVMFEGKDISTYTEVERKKMRGQQIGMIFQNPKASFNPIRTFRKQFIETLKSHGRYDRETFKEQVFDIFEKLNLSDGERILDSYPYEMSGGMNQRIAIALSVLLEPILLLADEPTSSLDSRSKEQVVDELLRLRNYYQMTMIIVTHDIHMVSRIADKIGVMHEGRIVELSDAKEVMLHPQKEETKKLLNAVPKLGDIVSKGNTSESHQVLNIEGVSKAYIHNKKVHLAVSKMNLELKSGEIMGIVGESGCGKSTLLKLIGGLLKPTEGVITYKGKVLLNRRTREEYRSIQMIFQNAIESFHPKLKIRYSLSESLRNLCGMKKKDEVNERINQLMELVGLDASYADRYPYELSGGECQRAAIARAISVKPELLLCDEITSALDVCVQAEIIELLLKLAKEYQMTIIFVSHDIALLSNICEKIMIMQNGECIELGKQRRLIDWTH